MWQGSGGKDIFKYRWIHQRCSNRLKVINITLIPLLGIVETNSFSERLWLGTNPLQYVRGGKSAYQSIILVEGLEVMKLLLRFFPWLYFVFGILLSLSVCSPLYFLLCACCWLLLPFVPPSVFFSLPTSGLDCAVKALIVCLRVISCLNEGQVNEINFSCPCMGIALTDSRIAGLSACFCVCVCHSSPTALHKLAYLQTLAVQCVKLLYHLQST